MKNLFKQNENVFEISSPEGNVSYIWTYTVDEIIIYHLIKRRVTKVENFQIDRNNSWLKNKIIGDYQLRNCIATDSGSLTFLIKDKENVIEKEYPILLSCLQKTTFESEFYKNLQSDINKYHINWYK